MRKIKRKLKINGIRKYVLVADATKEFKIQETILYYKQAINQLRGLTTNQKMKAIWKKYYVCRLTYNEPVTS